FFSSRRRHTRSKRDWSSDVCSSDLAIRRVADPLFPVPRRSSRAWPSHSQTSPPPPGPPLGTSRGRYYTPAPGEVKLSRIRQDLAHVAEQLALCQPRAHLIPHGDIPRPFD